MSVDVKYRTIATASGGRDGNVLTDDGKLVLRLTTPKELGGSGDDGTNPEQLFAAGYSACFLSAVKVAAKKQQVQLPPDVSVSAIVGIGARSEGGYGLRSDLVISLPGLQIEAGRQVIEAADQICPYSNATRNNIEVGLFLI